MPINHSADEGSSSGQAATNLNSEKAGNDSESALKPRARRSLLYIVVIEVKSTELLNANSQRQLLNRLRATPLEIGLLLHFGPKPKFFRLIAPNRSRPE